MSYFEAAQEIAERGAKIGGGQKGRPRGGSDAGSVR
jgi:hypothetical protein